MYSMKIEIILFSKYKTYLILLYKVVPLKIFGSQFLQPDVSLKIEIIDKGGNTVYTQPVKYGQLSSPKLSFRYISVEVYPPPVICLGR